MDYLLFGNSHSVVLAVHSLASLVMPFHSLVQERNCSILNAFIILLQLAYAYLWYVGTIVGVWYYFFMDLFYSLILVSRNSVLHILSGIRFPLIPLSNLNLHINFLTDFCF